MNALNLNYLLIKLAILIIATFTFCLLFSPNKAFSIEQTALAEPSSFTYHPRTSSSRFASSTPTPGTWTTTVSDLPDTTLQREGRTASYTLPQINTCPQARIRLLTIEFRADGNTTPYTDTYSGVFSYVTQINTGDWLPVVDVPSGSRMNGVFARLENLIGRGSTNDNFTGINGVSIPGQIYYSMNTGGLTANEYNNLSIQVEHDLRDGPLGFITSVSSTQPIVRVDYDESPCGPPVGPPSTGVKQDGYNQPLALILASLSIMWITNIHVQRSKIKK